MQEDAKKLSIGIAVVAVGGISVFVADFVIRNFFPERIILNDLLFRLIPNIPLFSYVADGLVTFGFLVLLLWLTERRLPKIAEFLFAVGLMLFFRSILNVLTPIGDPSGDTITYGFLERTPLLGMFPSGHIASLSLEYWLIRYWKTGKAWEYFFLLMIVLEAFALLSTRGHYSIDIAGGLALGYIVVQLTKKYI